MIYLNYKEDIYNVSLNICDNIEVKNKRRN